ncbi:hypothetical protein D3C86_1760600 [compost metagenome]
MPCSAVHLRSSGAQALQLGLQFAATLPERGHLRGDLSLALASHGSEGADLLFQRFGFINECLALGQFLTFDFAHCLLNNRRSLQALDELMLLRGVDS